MMAPGSSHILQLLKARKGRTLRPGSSTGAAFHVAEPSGLHVADVSHAIASDLWAYGHTRPIPSGRGGGGFELRPADAARTDSAGELLEIDA